MRVGARRPRQSLAPVRHQNLTCLPIHSGLVKAMMAASLTLCLAHPAGAQTPSAAFVPTYTGTLKKIDETEAVQIGYRDNSPPFAFLDANKKPIGYSLDLSRSLSTKSPQKRASLALFAVVTQNQ
jgi:ABC-type amino acid transport substrate-binding protein